MHNNLKNYSINTGSGTQLGFEFDRVNALTGRRKEDYLNRLAKKDANGNVFSDGVDSDSARLHVAMRETKLYVIDYNGVVHVTLMTEDAYQMIRRPEMSVLKSLSVKDAISFLSKGLVPNAHTSRAYERNWLIHNTVYTEHVELAEILNLYYMATPENTAGITAAQFARLYAFDRTVTDIVLYSDGVALKTLAAIAIEAASTVNGEFWPLSLRSAWEELIRTGSNHKHVNDLYMRLTGASKLSSAVQSIVQK